MMGEVAGGLIQMNLHMVMKSYAELMIVTGVLIAIFSGLFMFIIFADCGKLSVILRRVWVFMVMMILGIGLVIAGLKVPRVKEIKACASGPVSLEQIATRYQIMKVDGSELTLRVRGE